jgi:transposase
MNNEEVAILGPKQEAQGPLFYEFSLEDHVLQSLLLRSIDRFVDLSGIRQHLASFHFHTGWPSIDPELLIRMLLVGYCLGIGLERRLCEEVHLNLAYRWFCRLDLADAVPDHSTFSGNRHCRFRDSNLLRHLFETSVARWIAKGLVSGQRFAADASLIEADAKKQKSTSKENWDRSAITLEDAPRAVREYLDFVDDAAFGAATTVEPKFASHSDPSSHWTAARKGPAFFAYSTNDLIDTDTAVIVDVAATRSIRQAELGYVSTILDRVNDKFDLHPERIIADTAYGSGPMPGWLVDRKIAPHIPVIDKAGRNDGTRAGTAPIVRPEQCERRISTRCNRPKSPQTRKDTSCTAANAKSLTRKTLGLHPKPNLLRSQHGVFPRDPHYL